MKSDAIRVRDYRPSYLDALIALWRGSIRQIASRDYTREQIMAWAPDRVDREAAAARNLSRRVWVAEIGDVVVGYTDLESTGHLDRLYVHADFQRLGVASALLLAVEAAAAEQAIIRLFSEVSITAKPFFERRGFHVIAPQTVMFNGYEYLNYRMEKHLKNSDGLE
jgi:putative acetyltransferase